MDQIRPWPFNLRTNQTFRPTAIDIEGDIQRTVCVIEIQLLLDTGGGTGVMHSVFEH